MFSSNSKTCPRIFRPEHDTRNQSFGGVLYIPGFHSKQPRIEPRQPQCTNAGSISQMFPSPSLDLPIQPAAKPAILFPAFESDSASPAEVRDEQLHFLPRCIFPRDSEWANVLSLSSERTQKVNKEEPISAASTPAICHEFQRSNLCLASKRFRVDCHTCEKVSDPHLSRGRKVEGRSREVPYREINLRPRTKEGKKKIQESRNKRPVASLTNCRRPNKDAAKTYPDITYAGLFCKPPGSEIQKGKLPSRMSSSS